MSSDIQGLRHMSKEKKQTRQRYIILKRITFLFLVYVGSYCIMSALGAYMPSQSGLVRFHSGLSATDIHVWFPRLSYGQLYVNVNGKCTFRGNILGYVYAPLILFDQAFVHKTIKLSEL